MRHPNRTYTTLIASTVLVALACCLAVCTLNAAPTPALVPPPGTWQLDLQLHGQPRQIAITLPGDTEPQSFWYLPYTISNNTSHDAEFYPRVELFTDTLKLYQAGVGVRRPIFEAIRRRYHQSLPLLEPQSMLTGRVLQGQDNARDSVIIIRDFDPNATTVKLFFTGLSSETVTVDYPVQISNDENPPKRLLLRKTLVLQYDVPGDAINLEKRVMLYRGRQWIMR